MHNKFIHTNKIRSKLFLKLILVFIAGSMIPFSLSPYDISILAFLSIIILFYISTDTKLAEHLTLKKAALYGYFYGLGAFGFGVNWIYISIHEHGNASPLLAGFLMLLLILVLALFPMLKILFYKYLSQNNNNNKIYYLLLLAPSVWVFIDWLQSWIFTGFPWLYIGYSQLNTPLAGFAPLVSVFGLSFLVVFAGNLFLLIVKWLISYSRNYNKNALNYSLYAITILAVLFTTGSSLKTIQWSVPDKNQEKTVLVQANITQNNRWKKSEIANNIKKYVDLTGDKWKNSTIIWAENAVPLPLNYVPELITTWQEKANINNSTLIFGVPVPADYINSDNKNQSINHQYLNAIYSISYQNKPEFYFKNKLVPWGEYVPFEKILRGLINFFDLPMSNFVSGEYFKPHFRTLHSKYITWLPFICYEIAYPDYVISHAKLGNAIITISNDAWFGNSIGPWQHFQLARMRALETARPVIRSTNNGITAFIDPKGKVIKRLPQFTADTLVYNVSGYTGSTPIMYIGINGMMSIFFMILLFFAYRRIFLYK